VTSILNGVAALVLAASITAAVTTAASTTAPDTTATLNPAAPTFNPASYTTEQLSIPSVPAATHELDPLLGKWTYVEYHKGASFHGVWTFTRSADGFMVSDEFRTENGRGGTGILAETYRTYDPARKTWNMAATLYTAPIVGNRNGEWDVGVTTIKDGEVFDEITKGNTIGRVHFYNITKTTFSCRIDTSNDLGKTWVNPSDIRAERSGS
jgi:hypothetical protein